MQFSHPTKQDGSAMWEIVNETSLDQNSAYKYIMMADFFAETCLVAKQKDDVVGFVTAFRQPNQPNTLFIWQIGVKPSAQGLGIASQLLQELIKSRLSPKIEFVEATVTPSNGASQALFKKLAQTYETNCDITPYYQEDLFPGEHHEEELMFKIGPLPS
ncbi:diaminobutyrate acetyltransferase [Alkalihalobacillus pseudalcaliphilus]|uniref:diaminobutyrate acetyltransferase n=1 Tax=Alkalihalobacillus pseudalcaliphilus TaxID=79884 RepID=UPI002361838D|nr:diaminobutyrate acetyltransferase [Alkalihalobacillus pseudalcaliphilus]